MPNALQRHPSASARSKSAILLEAALSLLPRLQGSLTRAMLIEHLAEVAGSSAHPFSIRDAFEMLECACVMHMMRAGEGPEPLLPWLLELYQRLPTQTVRSEVQVSRQQFSTPAPLALFAQSRAALRRTDLVLEPSAGTGLLATDAARLNAGLHLNELDPHRRALVGALYPAATVTGFDGAAIGPQCHH